MNRYPYPVLDYENSSYKENIVFELEYVKNFFMNGKVVFEFQNKMSSEYLKKLISEGRAKAYVKIQSNIYAFLEPLNIFEEKCFVSVETEKLLLGDNLKFVAIILADDNIEMCYHDELLDIYMGDYVSFIRKKDLLAKSNVEKMYYNSSNNDFIKFKVSEELTGKGYRVSIAENFISIIVGPEFNVAYGTVKGVKEVCSVFDSHLVFEVFIYAIVEFIQNYDESKEKEVFSLFEQIFVQSCEYDDFETFIKNVKDGEKIDMAQVYEAAHKMVNNQIESTLIAASKKGA